MSHAIDDARPTKTPLRAALSSWTGSALEYYDFAVYGTAAALVLNVLFFPESTAPGVSILLAMATVGVAYVVRPLGALIMGPLGDRFGRKFVLMLTLFMMGISTFIVGCLPTFDQVGFLAPILLVLCRIIQGLSASGEQASAITVSLEHSAENRRSWTTGWTLHGTQFGTLLAVAVFIPFTTFLPEEQLFSWGWRVPFWLSAVVVLTAWLIRRGLEEPPAFKESRADSTPLREVFARHKTAVFRVAACAMVNTVNMVFTVWSLSYATSIVGLDRSTMLLVSVTANAVALLAIPLASLLADRIGRKPVFVTGALCSGLMMFPYLGAVSSGDWTLIFISGALMSGGFYSMANGVWPSFYAEMFPTSVRVTGLALGTQIGFALSGGLAPALASAVAGPTGENWVSVAAVTAGICLVVAVVALTAAETKSLSLAEVDELHLRREPAGLTHAASPSPGPESGREIRENGEGEHSGRGTVLPG